MFDEFDESVNNEQVADVQEEVSETPEVEVDNDTDNMDTQAQESENIPEVAEQERDYDKDKIYAEARRRAEREAENKLKAMQAEQESFAKNLGYNSFDELKHAQAKQQYIDQGYDDALADKMLQVDTMLKKAQEQENKVRIAEAKSKLINQKYFKDLEPEIDAVLESDPNLSVELVFNYLKGQRMEELITKASKVAEQKARNNMNSKNHIRPDGGGVDVDTTHIDEEEFALYKRLNPKASKDEWRKFKKELR